MKVLHIATVGDDIDPILVGIREYPVSKLILLYMSEHEQIVNDLHEKLAFLKIEIERRTLSGEMILMDLLQVVGYGLI